jgi:hypothetical protein
MPQRWVWTTVLSRRIPYARWRGGIQRSMWSMKRVSSRALIRLSPHGDASANPGIPPRCAVRLMWAAPSRVTSSEAAAFWDQRIIGESSRRSAARSGRPRTRSSRR